MNTHHQDFRIHHPEQGSTLIVGLVLLLALTILGVAGMGMARTELLMTQNSQFLTLATATAESQVDITMNPESISLVNDLENQSLDNGLSNAAVGSWELRNTGTGAVPVGSFSKQGGMFAARFYEFETSIEEYGIDTNVAVVQGGFIITPGE